MYWLGERDYYFTTLYFNYIRWNKHLMKTY